MAEFEQPLLFFKGQEIPSLNGGNTRNIPEQKLHLPYKFGAKKPLMAIIVGVQHFK